jgi:hypothetical protein
MSRIMCLDPGQDFPFDSSSLERAWEFTDELLLSIPKKFGMDSNDFYTILNQRNLSGFIGEIFKHALAKNAPGLAINPHPDGRPDLLDIRSEESRNYFDTECLDNETGQPIRSRFAPYLYGGVEVKCSIGDLASGAPTIGVSRANQVRSITYWAHHRHACNLLGLYYDFDQFAGGSPQVKALLFAYLTEEDWNKVSIGDSSRKKTSNTSINKFGKKKLINGLIGYSDDLLNVSLLNRLRIL